MNPKIWGPKLWLIIYDLSYICETFPIDLKPSKTLQRHYQNIFESFQFLLPCIYCRESYRHIYQTFMDGSPPPFHAGALQWTYRLKCLVNRKLRQRSIQYTTFKKRMSNGARQSSKKDVEDILRCFRIMAYDIESEDVSKKTKQHWYKKFERSLTKVMNQNMK